MATKEQVETLTNAFAGLMKKKGFANARQLFNAYDKNNDGQITMDELVKLLKAADIGNWATRSTWAEGIIEAADSPDSPDQKISWPEYQKLVGGSPTASLKSKLRRHRMV